MVSNVAFATTLEDLCAAILARRFIDTRAFPPDLQSELVQRAEAEITRHVDRANRLLANYAAHDEDGDDDE
jgi:hypothetical protein